MVKRYLRSEQILRIQQQALASGGRLRPTCDGKHTRIVEWDVSGNCLSPVFLELKGRPEMTNERSQIVCRSNPSRFVDMEVACRKCVNCLRRRAAMWRIRSFAEYRTAPRTWLCTFTLRPAAVVHLLSRARVELRKVGTDYDTLSEAEQFIEFEREGYKDVQLWLKRLRKAKYKVRYLAITEVHKSGLPHWHMLLHEQDPDKPIREKFLSGSWSLGFDSYRLIRDARAAGYVTKYLSKAVSARVRASEGYGEGNTELDAAFSSDQAVREASERSSDWERAPDHQSEEGKANEVSERSESAGYLPQRKRGEF